MFKREQLQLKFKKLNERLSNTPLMTILFATSTSLMLYQNCSVSEQSSTPTKSGAVYSSTIGGASGPLGPSTGGFVPGGAVPGTVGGAVPVPGGTGGTGGGGTGGTGGGAVTVPPGTGGTGGTGGSTGGSGGGTGVNPGGTTGGSSTMTGLIWQYQPEDRTVEEGDVLTMAVYATKGVDVVTYQWYKNGQALSGQTSYMLRVFMVPLSQAGNYHVVARSGVDSIQSVTVAVKVKAARNPCPAGFYGYYPGTNNYNEYWHESFIGKVNASENVPKELADGYTIRLSAYPYSVNVSDCVAASGIFQCRNGKLISTDQTVCTQQRESGGP